MMRKVIESAYMGWWAKPKAYAAYDVQPG
jgi:hypothetical protein